MHINDNSRTLAKISFILDCLSLWFLALFSECGFLFYNLLFLVLLLQGIIVSTSAETLEKQMILSIALSFLMFIVFFQCNILFVERRRNFLILRDLRNKNHVIDYLEQNGNVVSFTVEIKSGKSIILAVSNSCQRLYGYYPSEMIGKQDESFVAKEDVSLFLFDYERARKKLFPDVSDQMDKQQHLENNAIGVDARGEAKLIRHLRYSRVLASGEKVRYAK